MLTGNQMEKQLVNAGYDAPKAKRKRQGKTFTCHKCGNPMTNPDWFNGMYCEKCDSSFFIFDKERAN